MCCVGSLSKAEGVDLFNEVVRRNFEGVVAKRKTGTYTTVSGWLKIKNPNYTQTDRRYELFEAFKAKATNRTARSKKATAPAVPVPRKITGKSRRRSEAN